MSGAVTKYLLYFEIVQEISGYWTEFCLPDISIYMILANLMDGYESYRTKL